MVKILTLLLFLDIDGVLNAFGTPENNYQDRTREITPEGMMGIDPLLVARLNRLVESVPDLRFVMSSTWRKDYAYAKRYLRDQGFKGVFVGKTPSSASGWRSEEIQAWIAEAGFTGKFATLDDDHDAECDGALFVNTRGGTGLTEAEVDTLIAYFQ